MQRYAHIGQRRACAVVAFECRRLVVAVCVDGLHAQGLCQGGNLLGCTAVAHDQPHIGMAVLHAQVSELAIQVVQAVQDELDPTIDPGQGIKDVDIENEDAPNLLRSAQRVVERRVIGAA